MDSLNKKKYCFLFHILCVAIKIDIFVEGDYLVGKNNLQRKKFVDTSNKQGLESLKKLYSYLTTKPFEIVETETHFSIRIPLL